MFGLSPAACPGLLAERAGSAEEPELRQLLQDDMGTPSSTLNLLCHTMPALSVNCLNTPSMILNSAGSI